MPFTYSRRTYEQEYHRGTYRLHSRKPAEVLAEWEKKGYRKRAKQVWKAMPVTIKGTVLEVACHHGKMAVWMLEEFPQIEMMHMFDFSAPAVEHCKRIVRERARMKIWRGDVRSIPSADNTYDFVNCTDVTEHLPKQIYLEMIAELSRVLKPKGHLLLLQGTTRLPEHIHVLPQSQLLADFARHGLKQVCRLPRQHHLLTRQ